MSADAATIECRRVTKVYRTATSRVEALRGVDAVFRSGRFTVVMGPSGSGKSSLLRILAGLDRPTTGNVAYRRGASVYDVGDMRGAGLRYIFQAPADNLLPYLTVTQHLRAFGPRDAAGGDALLAQLGLQRRAHQLPHRLSGGEQQRAGLAHALLGSPAFVIADEPTSELDHDSAELLIAAMRRRTDAGTGFVVATHDPRILDVADEVLHIEWGKIVDAGEAPAGRPGAPRSARPQGGELLHLRGVCKTYTQGSERIVALGDADLEVSRGEVVALMGPSGSGKSTLLNIVAGWEQPDAGELSWAVAVGSPPSWDEVAVVPQALGLLDELTLGGNVRLPGKLSGRALDASGLTARLGIDHLADRYPREVSIGEQQRCALARALCGHPVLLVADEPTAHQDRASIARILDAMHEAAERGTALLIATHDDEVAAAADRVVNMRDGRILSGTS